MSDFDWKNAIRTIAPGLGTLLGGPLVGGAIAVISNAVLGRSDGTEAEVAAAVQAGLSPEQVVRLKEIDAELAKAGIAADIRKDELVVEDRTSARGRDVELVKAGQMRRMPAFLVILDACGVFICLVTLVLFKGQLTEGVTNLIAAIATGFLLCLRDAHSFEFGSSRGSQLKDETIAKVTGK